MTATTEHTPDLPEPTGGSRNWENIATGYARKMAQADFRRGDLADLRRMDPASARPAVFWRLMAEENLLERGRKTESKWALILHGIALMTPTNAENNSAGTAHDGNNPVGQALYDAGYSEIRFNQLLTAREDMLQKLLVRTFRMVAAKNIAFNWREMTKFILNHGHDEAETQRSRRRLARGYYSAEQRAKESN